MPKRPNVVFVFADQWRQQATGFNGDPNVSTPHIDRLAGESIQFPYAVSGFPVCSPYRACFLTGQRALTHGVFVNDVTLDPEAHTVGKVFARNGYRTAYIGKWHLDGHGRSNPIPPERRQGFEYWKVLECTHNYPNSAYYSGDSDEQVFWDGYDANAQTGDAVQYIREADPGKPFFLVLSWGPPHNPYETAPKEFRDLYDPDSLTLRPNVPEGMEAEARKWLAGYYAHCSALDACVGRLREALRESGQDQDTLFIFTSDHGDMLGSQGHARKQRPWDESIRVPFLLRFPSRFGDAPRTCDALIDAPDIMPTLLGLCGMEIPQSVEGLDYSGYLQGGQDPSEGAALITCYHTFGEWTGERASPAGTSAHVYRGLRTRRHTYVRSLDGPWLFYDNEADPFQMRNLAGLTQYAEIQDQLDARLTEKLASLGDAFLPGREYVRKWGYPVDDTGTVPSYKNKR